MDPSGPNDQHNEGDIFPKHLFFKKEDSFKTDSRLIVVK